MKTILTSVIALFIVGTGVFPQEMAEGRSSTLSLEYIAGFAEEEQLEVKSWSITIKEAFNSGDVSQVIEEITSFVPQANVSRNQTPNSSKIVISNGLKNEEKTEQFILIVPKQASYQAELVYKLGSKGTPLPEMKKITEHVNQVKSRLFSKNVAIYSCLKTNASGIIDDVLVYENLKQTFDITTIEEVTEDGWTSRSGFTKKWGHPLPLADGQMNVQFATRTLGGKTTITIGTPIITGEY